MGTLVVAAQDVHGAARRGTARHGRTTAHITHGATSVRHDGANSRAAAAQPCAHGAGSGVRGYVLAWPWIPPRCNRRDCLQPCGLHGRPVCHLRLADANLESWRLVRDTLSLHHTVIAAGLRADLREDGLLGLHTMRGSWGGMMWVHSNGWHGKTHENAALAPAPIARQDTRKCRACTSANGTARACTVRPTCCLPAYGTARHGVVRHSTDAGICSRWRSRP